MGNQLNLCKGDTIEPYEQNIVHEPDARVNHKDGSKGRFTYYDPHDKVYVSFYIKIIVRIRP